MAIFDLTIHGKANFFGLQSQLNYSIRIGELRCLSSVLVWLIKLFGIYFKRLEIKYHSSLK